MSSRLQALVLVLAINQPTGGSSGEPESLPESLLDRLVESAQTGELTAPDRDDPSRDDLDSVQLLFLKTLEASEPKDAALEKLTIDWTKIGFELSKLGPQLWGLRETQSRQEGRGVFALRQPRLAMPVFVQAPHAVRDDTHTGDLALGLFRDLGAAAGGWSTLPREQIDLAHTETTVWQQATRAFALRYQVLYDQGFHNQSLVLQLHGFRRDRRESRAGKQAHVILSNGTREPGQDTRRLARCLASELSTKTGVYPTVPELGATTNEQGRAVRRLGGRFLHVEMSRSFRERLLQSLRENGDDWRHFTACLRTFAEASRESSGGAVR